MGDGNGVVMLGKVVSCEGRRRRPQQVARRSSALPRSSSDSGESTEEAVWQSSAEMLMSRSLYSAHLGATLYADASTPRAIWCRNFGIGECVKRSSRFSN